MTMHIICMDENGKLEVHSDRCSSLPNGEFEQVVKTIKVNDQWLVSICGIGIINEVVDYMYENPIGIDKLSKVKSAKQLAKYFIDFFKANEYGISELPSFNNGVVTSLIISDPSGHIYDIHYYIDLETMDPCVGIHHYLLHNNESIVFGSGYDFIEQFQHHIDNGDIKSAFKIASECDCGVSSKFNTFTC